MFRLLQERQQIGKVFRGTFELDPSLPIKQGSLLSFDITCILVLNKELVDCRLLLPHYEQPRLVGHFSLAKNFHVLYKSPPLLYSNFSSEGNEKRVFEFAFMAPPEISFPTVKDSLVLRINWFINVKLLPEGSLWTKTIDILPSGERFMTLANLVQTRSNDESGPSLYVRSREQNAKSPFDSIQSLEDVVFALSASNNPIDLHLNKGECIFDIKHDDQPFCKISHFNDRFTITFVNPTVVLNIALKVFMAETISPKYSSTKDELVLKNVIKTKELVTLEAHQRGNV